ncbi:flavin-containing monooxygenase [Mycolicibacterium brumae]|uniref:FAD-containing monooxygenase EthA n=1 Tax=Mycolicibacterium brumae TaxID=85968 RepID=A0A2G5PDI9_9MYCO|nr:NAD(P)/FAD-dependent oxidoreductase [Mycolicibacterium brumae]MCV7191761.1 NAD(P)/FAD-dependent oxidoreductase [Mycolicibacterium brumae]PIB76389.1 NAD(P)/FAD-dependent oxidoreductase [Mycolicibacterium brumae]UWW07067.1 NAD(P)/FAD-dependent oxidoreductase [Mycolicibacterium brumae]
MTEHFDVVIVGAGISGISAAYHLQKECPNKSYVLLERRDDLGGTWDLFRYPGIRSDSDMYTLGFHFKPWNSARGIADGGAIKNYLREAVEENGIDKHVRYGQKVLNADWSDADNQWTLNIDVDGEQSQITAGFAMVCTGYYNYDQGYRPAFPGEENFTGTLVHPQHWPENLDYQGKKVVVIGSGATAVTLLPALANSGAGHVTMLQRSPTYIGALPGIDPLTEKTLKFLPASVASIVNRTYKVGFSTVQYQLSRRFPGYMRKTLLTMAKHKLPKGYDVEKHFGPRYNPWEQRVCLAPDGDIFKTIRKGQASVVTDTIETFTPTGIKLSSGEELEADIIITATGLDMQIGGGATITRNGQPIDLSESMLYKTAMLTGVPNATVTIGYLNASWTLKADLLSEWACRLLKYMDDHGYNKVVPEAPADVTPLPYTQEFSSGYLQRAMPKLPKSGDSGPWRVKQNYLHDVKVLRFDKIEDDALHFSHHRAAEPVNA